MNDLKIKADETPTSMSFKRTISAIAARRRRRDKKAQKSSSSPITQGANKNHVGAFHQLAIRLKDHLIKPKASTEPAVPEDTKPDLLEDHLGKPKSPAEPAAHEDAEPGHQANNNNNFQHEELHWNIFLDEPLEARSGLEAEQGSPLSADLEAYNRSGRMPSDVVSLQLLVGELVVALAAERVYNRRA